nr:hypothetical protein [Armatimonas sp.]
MNREYPSHLDLEWLGVDRAGYIGIFTTGGKGPIPEAYLEDELLLDSLSKFVRALPEICGCQQIPNIAQPADDFIAFARRGLFAFDWADVHRTTEFVGMYEVEVRPDVPLKLTECALPADLRTFLAQVTSFSMDFSQFTVDVYRALKCVRPHQNSS